MNELEMKLARRRSLNGDDATASVISSSKTVVVRDVVLIEGRRVVEESEVEDEEQEQDDEEQHPPPTGSASSPHPHTYPKMKGGIIGTDLSGSTLPSPLPVPVPVPVPLLAAESVENGNRLMTFPIDHLTRIYTSTSTLDSNFVRVHLNTSSTVSVVEGTLVSINELSLHTILLQEQEKETGQEKEDKHSTSASSYVSTSTSAFTFLKSMDVRNITVSVPVTSSADKEKGKAQGQGDNHSNISSTSSSSGTRNCDDMWEQQQQQQQCQWDQQEQLQLVYIHLPDEQPLHITVAPVCLDTSSKHCLGLKVIDIPIYARVPLHTGTGTKTGLQLEDVLISICGRDLCAMSCAIAVSAVRGTLDRRVTVIRKIGLDLRTGAGSAGAEGKIRSVKENLKSHSSSSSNSNINIISNSSILSSVSNKRSSSDAHEDECTISTSEKYHALKRRLVTRSNTRSIYAAGCEVPVDYTRQRPPTMIYNILPMRPGSRASIGISLGDDPYVSTMHHMRTRMRVSAQTDL